MALSSLPQIAFSSIVLGTTSNGASAGRDAGCGREVIKLSLFCRLVALTSDESGDEDEQQEVDDDGDSSNGSSSPVK